MEQKKGDILAVIVFLVIMIIIAVSFLFFSYLFGKTSDILLTTPLGNSTEGQTAIGEMNTFGLSGIQNLFLILFGGMLLAMMLTAFFVRTHPVFLIIYILLLIINLIVAIFMKDVYMAMNVGEIASTYASQTIIKAIMENIVRITLIAEGLSLILLFAKLPFDNGYGGGL